MDNSLLDAFRKSIETGFVDGDIVSEVLYQPELLLNSKKPPSKVLTSIIEELENCSEFYFSVAFATTGGVAGLINQFALLESRNIKGKILVSQYLNFTQPEALRRLSQFKNIDLRIAVGSNSHTKGYIFKFTGYYNLIVGSSNLTQTALATNREWNLKVSATNSSGIVGKVLQEFHKDFEEAQKVSDQFISTYEELFKLNFKKEKFRLIENNNIDAKDIVPNLMQQAALANISALRRDGKGKALLISATGTGKTYLSAFDAQSMGVKRLLFVVHRQNIALKAMKSFRKIFEKNITMGVFSGNRKDLECDYLFSTVQTISKKENLQLFDSELFDYIIIDESHRSGAESYRRLLDYFNPKFLLGMTATPERTDGFDVFSLFDHNIAYEIRLHRAMEENMLTPFHYYGVSELIVDEEIHEEEGDFRYLELKEKVDKIIDKIEFYGCDDGEVRGLIFCSRNDEADLLSSEFNERGYRTLALSGKNSEEDRKDAIERLESSNSEEKLDYIFSVDIFNEGIDIPSLNQIVMIRPTDSAIIFVQQLGRGLRKLENKQYLTVIDFIGNYKNNYLIPIALYGDTSYSKDSLRKLISEGSKMIPGASTINFDEISKEQIYKSIDSANMRLLSDLKKDYNLLKYKLGRIPLMMDFVTSGSRNPYLYVDYSKSYFNFVARIEEDYSTRLNLEQSKLLELFNSEINNTKRIEETILLKMLLEKGIVSRSEFAQEIEAEFGYKLTGETIDSCSINLNFEFIKKPKQVIKENKGFQFAEGFIDHLKNDTFRTYLIDNINCAISIFKDEFEIQLYKNGFLLYKKYTRKDVCRILNWPQNWESTVYGYKIFNDSAPLFVTYQKAEDISESTKYNDHFVSRNEFAWESKSNRTLKSPEIIKLSNSNNNDLRLLLFIQKSNDEGTDFYYMGDVDVIEDSIEQGVKQNDKGNDIPVVHFNFKMQQPVQGSIYDYIVEKPKITKRSEIIQLSRPEVENEKELILFENAIPYYDFYAAAGSFSEIQSDGNSTLYEIPKNLYNPKQDYFACKIVGDSMNKKIPSGSICLFMKPSAGSRNGKIVLVEYFDRQDPDFNSAFTIKKYESQKYVTDEGWSHSSIILKPESFDSSYREIQISEDDEPNLKIVGEFVAVLE